MEHYKKLCLGLFFVVCFFVFSDSANAQNYPDQKINSALWSGINSLLRQDYNTSYKIFYSISRKYPELPFGYVYMAAVKIAEAADYEEPFNETLIKSNLEKSEFISEQLIKKDANNPWNHYFLAVTKGYLAYFKALDHSYISAFSEGLTSLSSFEKCLALDPCFYDSYIALGAYKYWKSAKTEAVNWLPFVDDQRTEGIKLLHKALKHNSYNHYLGLNSLVWIYNNKKQYKNAVEVAKIGLKGFPENRSFRWGLARAYEDIDKRQAINEYRNVLNSVMQLKNNNHYNQILLLHKMAMMHRDIGEKEKAIELCNEILGIKDLKPYVQKKLEGRLEKVRNLKNELYSN